MIPRSSHPLLLTDKFSKSDEIGGDRHDKPVEEVDGWREVVDINVNSRGRNRRYIDCLPTNLQPRGLADLILCFHWLS